MSESTVYESKPQPETLAAAIKAANLSCRTVFVPFSESRNAKPKAKLSERSLNWKVTLVYKGRDVISFDYSAGIGHCPYLKNNKKQGRSGYTLRDESAIIHETEKGTIWKDSDFGMHGGKIPAPSDSDILYSILSDSSVLDAGTFENWAAEYGYDTDSRKAESIYRECLEHALQLRAAIGDPALQTLRDASQDY